mmetsp:Transcript_18046/g.27773  ORF Transcript_18046/g.27773 Transcript_18046/m.27773 type:complete len:2134 (-) Transcript_18046:3505-9906(-)
METITMADNFNDPFAQNLVGLWDFLGGNETGDTGLADGIAQNGDTRGDTSFSGDRAHFDGHGDVFDVAGDAEVAGNDAPFDLSEGTISVEFNQDQHVGSSPDTIVNRGEYDDRGSEGFFEIRVTEQGKVQVMHCANGEDVVLSTPQHFFAPGDDVKVTYTWSETEGGTFRVENLTDGTEHNVDYTTTGLTMDIGDNDDEAFSFGAREEDDGNYDHFFDGSIAYVAIYDVDVINNPPIDPDGIVDGTGDADLIDADYEGDPEGDSIDAGDAILPGEAPNDDIVDAGAGNDTILSGEGDDDVYAGSGDDSVEGGNGNDLIFGDSNFDGGAGSTVRESFEWDLAGAGNGDALGGFTQNTGNVNVTFSQTAAGANSVTEFSTNEQFVNGIDADGNPVDDNSGLFSNSLSGAGTSNDYNVAFSDPVENVSFRINDIDGDGVVRVTAFDADNNPIEVNLTAGGNLTLIDTDAVAGADTADSNGGYAGEDTGGYSVLVDIPGPVSRIEIEHDQNGPDNTGIWVTDVYFDADTGMVDNGADGDDTIFGEDGDDTIFGEGGNDDLYGGADNDSIDGGTGEDLILGDDPSGTGPNLIQNGSFEDTSGMTATGYGFLGDGAVPGWTETNGAEIDFHSDGRGGVDATDGSNWLDLSASPSEGVIGQDVTGLEDGQPYVLTFDAADGEGIPGGENQINVIWGGEVIGTIDPADSDMEQYTFVLTGGAGDGSDRLEFGNVGGNDNFGASIDNVSLTVLDDSVGGDDTLDGGDDDDAIFGQGGNDEITGGEGDDTLSGGADADTIFGGAGDEVDGGAGGFSANPANNTDLDVLDLTGQGPFFLDNVTDDSNGNGINGTVVFLDGSGNPNGLTLTFTEIEEVIGDEVNRDPDAMDDTAEVDEDGSVDINVLGNDSDPDGDDLEVTEATSPDGEVTINGDGSLTFEPNENFNGPTTITYTVSDGAGGEDTATVNVTVNPVNDAPDAVNDVAETDEDTAVTIDVLDNDTDVDGDDLTITGASVPADQGTVDIVGNELVFTPAENFNGDATITYTITDGNGGTDTGEVAVVVNPVNDDPVAVDDIETTDEDVAVVVDLVGNDTDVDGDDLTIGTVSVPPEQGTVVDNGDGTATFTPAPNFNGPATITYTVVDGNGGEDEGQAVVSVGAVNDGPVAEDDVAETDEDTSVNITVLTNDSDVDGDELNVISAVVPPEQGEVVVNGDNTLTFTPADDFNGEATITYTISDGNGGTDTADVVVTVNGVNDGPVANDDADTANEDGPAIDIDLTGNDTDADGDDLEIQSIDTTGTLGSVTINPDDDSVSYDANGAFESLGVGETATDTFTYTVEDGNGGTDTATVTVTVEGENDGPTANDDASDTEFDTPVTFDVLANDTDPDANDVLEITGATSPNGDVVNNGDGTLTFTPTPGFEGPAEITYQISDGNGGTDEGVWTVTVAEQPLDGIVSNGDDGALIDEDYDGDPEGDVVDGGDNIFSNDPEDADDDIIEAGGGNDTVIAGEGDDSVNAGTGDDQVHGGPGNDTLNGEEGEDTINGGAGDDSVDGGADDDEINTGDGSDTVEGGTGNDVIDTGNGEFLPDLGFPNDDGTPVPGFPFGFAADENPDDDLDSVDGGDGDDTISTGDDADTIVGGDGNDVIDGGIDDDFIQGDDSTDPTATGDDRIVGGEGNDLIEGGSGDDTIYAGNDPVLGLDQLNIEDDGSNPIFPADPRPDNGMDTVFGGDGNDVIFGADDDDELFGEEGNDTIDGEIDDDLIDGGTGDDSLLGGQGNDTIFGGDDNDFIDGGRNSDTLDGGDGSDTIFGGNGADSIDGGEGDDVLDGGTGDDTLNGGGGNDSITGATGDDVIDGGAGNDTIDGGNGGADIMSGGDDRDTFINVDAGETVDGNEGGDDFDTLDLRGSAPGGGSLNVVYDPGNPENGVVNYFDTNGDPAGTLTFSNIENVIPCFTPGTLIATPMGERKVEDLKVGDRIITRDNGIQQIRWVGARDMSGAELAQAAHLRPVLIQQGALGGGLPERDMLVSPQHRVLMANDKTALYFDESEVLVAAKHLTGMDGIDVVDVSETTYIHVMFDQHEVILSDGAWTESFQPGDQTLASMGDAQRAEILELFPELETATGIEAYSSARRSLKKHEAQLLSQ